MKSLKQRYAYIFETVNKYPSAPSVSTNIISKESILNLHNVTVQPVEVFHGNLPILGYRFNNIAYVTDIKTITEKEKSKLKDLDILIITGLRKEPHSTHFNIEEALDFVSEINPQKTYLTHISELLGFHEEVEKELPENVFLAYDGLTVYG